MAEMMISQAAELFKMCDVEEKGIITKRDMQRLRSNFPISPDQIEIVFDSLDEDGNGFLTLQEFTEGFGSFIGVKASRTGDKRGAMEESGAEEGDVFEGAGGEEVDINKVFNDMMMQIDARGVFQDEDVVKAMWTKLYKEEPALVGSFEEFISRTACDLKKSKGEFLTLEQILKSKSNEHEEEVKKLYEEMEFQMKKEQERILAEEKAKEKQLKEEMSRVLQEKELQLLEIQRQHQELEEKLAQLNMREAATKQDNQRLLEEKDHLEEMLSVSQDSLEESRSYIAILQAQQRDEKKERARAALQLSEGIAMERESLVKQLGMLKHVNKKLLDDKDEAEAIEARREDSIQGDVMGEALAQQAAEPPKQHKLVKQGSLLSKYFPAGPAPESKPAATFPENIDGSLIDLDNDDDDDIEMDDLTGAHIYSFHSTNHPPLLGTVEVDQAGLEHLGSTGIVGVAVGRNVDSQQAVGQHRAVGHRRKREFYHGHNLSYQDSYTSDAESDAAVFRSTGMLGSQTESLAAGEGLEDQVQPQKVQRVFKVVFVGDSGVGKSSFIFRFCNNTFKATFSATIGVDFQVKPLTVGDSMVVLQLWDTAGQERFRSVTKQYFRKADGVIIMYDVTSERSFLNIRQWMDSVREGVEEGTVVSIIGNKTDLAGEDPEKFAVRDGSKMAVEYDALFYETSAKTGSYINESMLGMASLLKDKEDKAMEAALNLAAPVKKKGCCS